MANQIKQLTSLVLLCIVIAAVIPPWAEAQVTCSGLITEFLPCASYVMNGGTIPPACCGALRAMVDGLKTKQDRQSACGCMKGMIATITPDQLKRAQALPDYCKVPLPFQLDPNVDCSAVPKQN